MLSSPLSVHLEVTDSCNNLCSHCYGSSWIRSGSKTKPEIIDVARKIVENDLFDVTITGGEPLLIGIERLSKIFQLFNDHDIRFTLNTNGRLLNKETCQFLKQYELGNVLISLHSWIDALHDEIVNIPNAATETKAGIKNALEEGLSVTVNQVIDNRNIDTMYSSSKELENIGVHLLSFTRALSPLDVDYHIEMVDAVRFLDEFIRCKEKLNIPVVSLLPIPFCADSRVKDLKGKLRCSGGISTAVVSCYGDVRFCPHDTQVWGNVFQEDLESIWKQIVRWRNGISVPSECVACSFVADCGGGCRVASKLCFNDYRAKDPWARNTVTNYRRKVIFDEFDPDSLYILLSDIRWRKENEYFLLHYKNGNLLVNFDGVKFLESLPQKFIPNELLGANSKNREMQFEYLKILYNSGLLVKAMNSWE